jgi:hypothetical protein
MKRQERTSDKGYRDRFYPGHCDFSGLCFPLFFCGVTDDPASKTYWKAANGIRLSGMPSFKTKLSDTQLWQVSELLAHANEIPETVKRVLVATALTPSLLSATGTAPSTHTP